MSQGAKPTAQARSRETRDKLLRALEDLLRDRDFEAITIADLAKQAGLAVGTVYRRFENKDAFIPAIFDLYRQRQAELYGEQGGIALDPEAGLRPVLLDLARQGWDFLTRERHIVAPAHLYSRLRPDLVGEEWDALLDQSAAGFAQLVRYFPDEVRRDPDEAGQMLSYYFNTALAERALYRETGVAARMTVTDLDFVRAIADFAYGYLVTDPAE